MPRCCTPCCGLPTLRLRDLLARSPTASLPFCAACQAPRMLFWDLGVVSDVSPFLRRRATAPLLFFPHASTRACCLLCFRLPPYCLLRFSSCRAVALRCCFLCASWFVSARGCELVRGVHSWASASLCIPVGWVWPLLERLVTSCCEP